MTVADSPAGSDIFFEVPELLYRSGYFSVVGGSEPEYGFYAIAVTRIGDGDGSRNFITGKGFGGAQSKFTVGECGIAQTETEGEKRGCGVALNDVIGHVRIKEIQIASLVVVGQMMVRAHRVGEGQAPCGVVPATQNTCYGLWAFGTRKAGKKARASARSMMWWMSRGRPSIKTMTIGALLWQRTSLIAAVSAAGRCRSLMLPTNSQ